MKFTIIIVNGKKRVLIKKIKNENFRAADNKKDNFVDRDIECK